jgi:hypothetical protein
VSFDVTEEQHALLSELARLDPDHRSAASFVRELVDQVTPLLRKTVPAMRAAAEELDTSRVQLRGALGDLMHELEQHDLLDAAPGAARPQRSEDGRAKRRLTHE